MGIINSAQKITTPVTIRSGRKVSFGDKVTNFGLTVDVIRMREEDGFLLGFVDGWTQPLVWMNPALCD